MKAKVYDHVRQYMRTWRTIKKRHPVSLVLILGADEFYHTIVQDADKVAQICGTYLENIPRLTCNDRHTMFPKSMLGIYLPKLVKAGERVVICDKAQVQEIVTSNKSHERK